MRATFDERERRAWAGRAHAYLSSFARLCAYPVPHLLDVVGVGQGVRLLDVGTGPGTVAAAAGERGAVVTAVDVQPDMAELASRTAPTAQVCVAALPHLPFADNEFDTVTANFVLNHVGGPTAALAELRRVTRVGGRVAVTVWAVPPASGAALLGDCVRAADASRPDQLLVLPADEDFERDEEGFSALLMAGGLTDVECRTITWDHRVSPEEWWSGPVGGVAYVGQVLEHSTPEVVARIRAHFDRLSAQFLDHDGQLVLPHRALLASGTA